MDDDGSGSTIFTAANACGTIGTYGLDICIASNGYGSAILGVATADSCAAFTYQILIVIRLLSADGLDLTASDSNGSAAGFIAAADSCSTVTSTGCYIAAENIYFAAGLAVSATDSGSVI